MRCDDAYIEVLDNGSLRGKYCERNRPDLITSVSNEIIVIYTSFNSSSLDFHAFYDSFFVQGKPTPKYALYVLIYITSIYSHAYVPTYTQ